MAPCLSFYHVHMRKPRWAAGLKISQVVQQCSRRVTIVEPNSLQTQARFNNALSPNQLVGPPPARDNGGPIRRSTRSPLLNSHG